MFLAYVSTESSCLCDKSYASSGGNKCVMVTLGEYLIPYLCKTIKGMIL